MEENGRHACVSVRANWGNKGFVLFWRCDSSVKMTNGSYPPNNSMSLPPSPPPRLISFLFLFDDTCIASSG